MSIKRSIDSIIQENFDSIEMYLMEKSDIDLSDDFITERSHGKLKYDFRLAKDVNTGHDVKLVYSLDNIELVRNNVVGSGIGHRALGGDTSAAEVSKLKRYGNTDHQSKGQKLLAIVDLKTGKRLQEITCKGPFGGKTNYDTAPVTLKVGDIDTEARFKSTYWHKGGQNDIYDISGREGYRLRGMAGNRATETGIIKSDNDKAIKELEKILGLFPDLIKLWKSINDDITKQNDDLLNISDTKELYSFRSKVPGFEKILQEEEKKSNEIFDSYLNFAKKVRESVNEGTFNPRALKTAFDKIPKFTSIDYKTNSGVSRSIMNVDSVSKTLDSIKYELKNQEFRIKDAIKEMKKQNVDIKNWKPGRKITESYFDDEFYDRDYITEASHGKLNSSFRMAVNPDNGHFIRIVFDLVPTDVRQIGDHANQAFRDLSKDSETKRKIRSVGSTDFSSIGTVKAIIDLDTKQKLKSVKTIGVIGSNSDTTRFTVPEKYKDPKLGDESSTFGAYPVSVREQIAKELKLNPPDAITFTVGEREKIPSYKSTRVVNSITDLYNSQWKKGRGVEKPSERTRVHISTAVAGYEKRLAILRNQIPKLNDEDLEDDLELAERQLKRIKNTMNAQSGENFGQTPGDARYIKAYKTLDITISDLEYEVKKQNKATTESVEELFESIEAITFEDDFTRNIEEVISEDGNDINPEDLLELMKDIEYGWYSKLDDHIHGTGEDDDEELFFANYRLQTPEETFRRKCGVCWDQVEVERQWFEDNDIDCNVFYIEIYDKQNCPTHTFLTFDMDGKFYWFEHSWGNFRGIHEYDSMNELLQDVKEKHQKFNNDSTSDVIITRISKPTFGISCEEYMQWARNQELVDPSDPNAFTEASHGKLKYDYRLAVDVKTGHQIKLVYSLDGMKLTQNNVFKNWINPVRGERVPYGGETDDKEVKEIRKHGNTDHQSYNQKLLAIVDLETGERLKEVTCRGAFNNHERKEYTLKVGDIETKDQTSFKSTYWDPRGKNTSHDISNREGFQTRGVDGRLITDLPGDHYKNNIFKTQSGINHARHDYEYQLKKFKDPQDRINKLKESIKIYYDFEKPDLKKGEVDVNEYGSQVYDLNDAMTANSFRTIGHINKAIRMIEQSLQDGSYQKEKQKIIDYMNRANKQVKDLKQKKAEWKSGAGPTSQFESSDDSRIYGSVIFENGEFSFMEAEENTKETKDENAPPPIEDEAIEEPQEENLEDVPQENQEPPTEETPTEEQPQELEDVSETELEDVPEETPAPEETPKKEEPKSLPKQTDEAESDKNGVRRKKLYIAFIEWCKEYNNKNTFGSIFDKDVFHETYPFVPDPMRYFYRLANPMLCVLGGQLTFFPVAELRKLNSSNKQLDDLMIFAATPTDLRVFNKKDNKIYRGTEEGGNIKLNEVLGETFDLYIQKMIGKGDILNAPLEEDSE